MSDSNSMMSLEQAWDKLLDQIKLKYPQRADENYDAYDSRCRDICRDFVDRCILGNELSRVMQDYSGAGIEDCYELYLPEEDSPLYFSFSKSLVDCDQLMGLAEKHFRKAAVPHTLEGNTPEAPAKKRQPQKRNENTISGSDEAAERASSQWEKVRKMKAGIFDCVAKEMSKDECTCTPPHASNYIVYSNSDEAGNPLIDLDKMNENTVLKHVKDAFKLYKINRIATGAPRENTCPLHAAKKRR